MTMTFTADSGVDLSNVKEGDAVSFTLKPAGKDDYTISAIKKN
jgi:Cu/Ag efflux protein CusF